MNYYVKQILAGVAIALCLALGLLAYVVIATVLWMAA